MSTQQTAKTLYVETNGTKYAYRRLGLSTGVPLLLIVHFRGTMDHWDPALINRLATQRPIILFDYAGVGKSSGARSETFQGWANEVVEFLDAIKINEIDLLGFSMGGMAAQMTALTIPQRVRKLVLVGTGPSWSEGAESAPEWAFGELAVQGQPGKEAFLRTFFSLSPGKQALGGRWWDRIQERTEATSGEPRSLYLDGEEMMSQVKSVMAFLNPDLAAAGSYARLGELTMPVFIANGNDDVLVPTSRSWDLFRAIKNAHLHLYPDSGHGFCFEYADLFAAHLALFLDGRTKEE